MFVQLSPTLSPFLLVFLFLPLLQAKTSSSCVLQGHFHWHFSHDTKMLLIVSTKPHEEAFEGKPWKAPITLETLAEACETGQQPKMATLPCSRRQRPIVALAATNATSESYTQRHKNLIFLISFPCWARVCSTSTKAVVSFSGLSTEERTESPVLLGFPPAHSDILDCYTSKQTLFISEKVKTRLLRCGGN